MCSRMGWPANGRAAAAEGFSAGAGAVAAEDGSSMALQGLVQGVVQEVVQEAVKVLLHPPPTALESPRVSRDVHGRW
jgi:hypothetical protein